MLCVACVRRSGTRWVLPAGYFASVRLFRVSDPHSCAGSSFWSALFGDSCCCLCCYTYSHHYAFVTCIRHRSSGCYKETQWMSMYRQSKTRAGNHRRRTRSRNASHQRRPTTLHEGQGSNPSTRALYMQIAKIPHTHQATPCGTIALGADKPARHPPRAQQAPAQRAHN